jgi:hypothetical protein
MVQRSILTFVVHNYFKGSVAASAPQSKLAVDHLVHDFQIHLTDEFLAFGGAHFRRGPEYLVKPR